MTWLNWFYTHLAECLAACGLLIVATFVFLGLWLRKHRLAEEAEPGTELAPPDSGDGALRSSAIPAALTASAMPFELTVSFLRAIKALRARTSGPRRLYQAPWYLLIGETGAGKSSLLAAVGGRDAAPEPGLRQGLAWRFFDHGVVLDVPGDFLLRPDGGAVHERAWRGLLRLLNRYRPLRAVDGVVLVLPAGDFAPATGLSPAELQRKAARIGEKLEHLQRESGLCFPVYVLVSKCDRLRGFASFRHALPEERLREIVGWSSPYRAETAFESAWVDEAFERVVEELNRVQSELFAERLERIDPAALYFFPGEMLRLRDGMRAFLHQIFRPSVYRDSFHCRGIYFCGDGAEAAAPAAEAAPDSRGMLGLDLARRRNEPRPVFVDDLFEKKIFPEWGLAYPESRAFSFRHSAMLTAQNATLVVLLVLFCGLGWGWNRLSRLQKQALPVLDLIQSDLGGGDMATGGNASLEHKASDLVRSIAALGDDRFVSAFLPASWFSSLDARIQDAVETAFEKTVLQGVLDGLVQRANTIGSATAPLASGTATVDPAANAPGDGAAADGDDADAADAMAAASLPTEQMPEYQALAQFDRAVAALDDNIERYQHIIQPGLSGDAENLNALMKYLQPAENFQAMSGDESYLAKALDASTGTPFPPEALANARRRVATEMINRTDALLAARYLHSPVLAGLQNLAAQINALQDSSHYSFEDLSDLQSSLDATRAIVASPQSTWMAGKADDLDAPLRHVTLDAIDRSAALPDGLMRPQADLENYIRNNTDADWQKLHDDLAAQQTSLTGPLLRFDGNTVALSAGVESLRLPIVDLMGMSFMGGHPNGSIPSPLAADSHLSWDPVPLQEAQDMVTAYNRYLNEGLLDAPVSVRDAFRRVALAHLTANLIDQVAQAATWSPADPSAADDTNAEIKSLQAAQPLLNDLLQDFTQLGQSPVRAQLIALLHAQAYRLLRQLDAEFTADAPYAAQANLTNWDGSGPPSLAAFDLPGKDDLNGYLSFERQQTEGLANAAAPLVNFLQQSPASSRTPAEVQLTVRWQELIATVRKYDNKVPGNSLAALEEYISANMDAVTPAARCQPAPGGDTAADPDYFVAARARLRKTVYDRCLALASDAGARDYTSLANLFNRTLAGRFPFAAPASGAVEADPDAIAAFYTQLGGAAAALQTDLGATPAAAFMRRIDALAPYWASLMANSAHVPVFDITPTFRVNRGRERGGNQIIAWTLRVGAQTAASDQPTQQPLRWRLGDPIALTLRWAKDAPFLPVAPAGASAAGIEVRDDSITFHYNDPWALFTLLARQKTAAADFDFLQDSAPVTLTFTVPIAPATPTARASAPASESAPVSSPTKVYLRIAITIPGKVESLPAPDIPPQAPALDANAYASTIPHRR